MATDLEEFFEMCGEREEKKTAIIFATGNDPAHAAKKEQIWDSSSGAFR
jgi:hypothetical protein